MVIHEYMYTLHVPYNNSNVFAYTHTHEHEDVQ